MPNIRDGRKFGTDDDQAATSKEPLHDAIAAVLTNAATQQQNQQQIAACLETFLKEYISSNTIIKIIINVSLLQY